MGFECTPFNGLLLCFVLFVSGKIGSLIFWTDVCIEIFFDAVHAVFKALNAFPEPFHQFGYLSSAEQ